MPKLSLRCVVAGLCGVLLSASTNANAQLPTTGPQQLLLTGLLASTNPASYNAQFNSVQTDSTGNVYLLLDQGDGIRLLKTDPTATAILAHAYIGYSGDSGVAAALDSAGNLYVTGTSTSGTLPTTFGAAFPTAADTSTNSFVAKFDQNLNLIFLTYAGAGRMSASAIAATSDAVFITGSIFSANLPVIPSGIIQAPASGSLQNGFVERFTSTGALAYATYLSGQNGNTVPDAIAADSQDDAYIAGYTTSSGYPTMVALIPDILGPTSGFLTKLTPAGDGLLFSTFIPGDDISALTIDTSTQTLLASGAIAPGQFPIIAVSSPLVSTTYQTLLRLPLDGSSVLSSTMLAPGTESTIAAALNNIVWLASTLNTPASLLPLVSLSDAGNSYALRINDQSAGLPLIDQAIRFGGLPTANASYASLPATLNSVALDPAAAPIFVGSAAPTASANLLSTETFDLPLYNTPNTVLPSALRSAVLPSGTCSSGSLCAGSAAYLAKVNPSSSAASLVLSVDNAPNLILRNLGSATATNLTFSAPGYTIGSDCPTSLVAGSDCNFALTGNGAILLTLQADNDPAETVSIPAPSAAPSRILITPKELDFGIETSTSPVATRTITVTNISQQSQTFISALGSNQSTPYSFSEYSSDCPTSGVSNTKTLAPNSSCHIILGFTASSTIDAFAQSSWTIGSSSIQLSGFSEVASLNLSATEIDFGTQFSGGITMPRYLYLSNNSSTALSHSPVSITTPFTLTDRCPSTLAPHTVCQIELTYSSTQVPSADSATLALDQGNTVLVTGAMLPQSAATGQSANPSLSVSPVSVAFPTPTAVATTSSDAETITIGNTGVQPFSVTLAITGDFGFTTNCPTSLTGGQSCTATLSFSPTQSGIRQGIFSVTTGSGTTPTYVSLSGSATGILGAPNATIAFGNVPVGVPSVQWYKITTAFTMLTASTTAPDFKAILIEDAGYGHGQPPPAAFSASYTSSCRNCWLGVLFTPSSAGTQATNLTLTANSAPAPISLTGTGTPTTGLVLTPSQEDFGTVPLNSSSAPILLTLWNYTATAVTLNTPAVSGDFSFSTAPTGGATCTGILAPNASCFLNIAFTPTATGQRNGTLTVGPNGSIAAPLTGYGAPAQTVTVTPSALIFNNVPGPSAITQTITLVNTGTAAVQVTAPTTTTPNFTATSNCGSLVSGGTCTITVIYTPGSAIVTDTLAIPVTFPTTGLILYSVPLTGAYTSEKSGLQIIPAQAEYGAETTSTLGATRQFTINNLTDKSITLSLNLPRQFVLSGSPCGALAPNASCSFSVAFVPLTNGDITGTIFVQGTPTDGSATLNGIAYVEGYGNGTSTLSITGNFIPGQSLLNFGQVTSGQSATQTLTLTNTGSSPLTIRRLTSQWPFLITANTCNTALAPASACTVTITYSPLNQITSGTAPQPTTDSGTLIVESDSITSPDVIDLAGSAAPITSGTASNVAPLVSYTVSQSSLTFPDTQVGNSSESQTIALSNTGTVPIHLSTTQTSSDFILQNACGTILPSASCTIAVTFTPQPGITNVRIAALEIASDSSTALEFVSLIGNAPPAALVLNPTSLNFGSVTIGSTAQLSLQVTNSGSTPTFFTGISTTGDYGATSDCPTNGNTLAATSSCTVELTFTPTQTGTRTGLVGVATSLSTLPIHATLTGTGVQSQLVLAPTSLNFGNIAVGSTASLSLTLTNTGTAAITDIALSITGDYAITTPCTLTTLVPGEHCTIAIAFMPTAIGQRDSNLTVSSASGSPTLVPLTGVGVSNASFQLTVDGEPSSTVTVVSERPASYNLQLTTLNGYTGTVILNCTPVNPGQYATCSLLPSSIELAGATQNAVATINTITTVATTSSSQSMRTALLYIFPVGLLWVRRSRGRGNVLRLFFLAIATLSITSCGGTTLEATSDPSIRVTPPGTYQYLVTASSSSGVQLTQSVTLNLDVTPKQ